MRAFMKNIFILITGVFFALALFFLTKNPDLMMWSIMTLQEKVQIEDNERDMAYKTDKNILDVFVADQWNKTIKKVTLYVLYDKENINIDFTKFIHQWQSLLNNNDWELIIELVPNWIFDYTQSILELPFSWEIDKILISEASFTLATYDEEPLAIWLLNTKSTTWNH